MLEEFIITFEGCCPYCFWRNYYKTRAKAEHGLALHIAKIHNIPYIDAWSIAQENITKC